MNHVIYIHMYGYVYLICHTCNNCDAVMNAYMNKHMLIVALWVCDGCGGGGSIVCKMVVAKVTKFRVSRESVDS